MVRGRSRRQTGRVRRELGTPQVGVLGSGSTVTKAQAGAPAGGGTLILAGTCNGSTKSCGRNLEKRATGSQLGVPLPPRGIFVNVWRHFL